MISGQKKVLVVCFIRF